MKFLCLLFIIFSYGTGFPTSSISLLSLGSSSFNHSRNHHHGLKKKWELQFQNTQKQFQQEYEKKLKALQKESTEFLEKMTLTIQDFQRKNDQEWKSFSEILSVALPALAVCIVEPALTLIDMYFINHVPSSSSSSSTISTAALAINGAIYNIIAAGTSPLCTGTTALVSRAIAKSLQNSISNPTFGSGNATEAAVATTTSVQSLSSILVNGMFLSLFSGSFILALLNIFGKTIITKYFNISIDQVDLYQQTWSYLLIRSFSLPFTLLSYIVIGFCLGIQNSIIPVISISLASIVNIAGDYLLIQKFKMGLAGAAFATTFATITSAVVCSTMLVFDHVQRKKKNEEDISSRQHSLSIRLRLNWFEKISKSLKGFHQLIDIKMMKSFFSTSLLILLGTIANTVTYSSGSTVSSHIKFPVGFTTADSQSLVATNIASHQVIMQVWWFLSFLSSPLSLAAQSILPKIMKPIPNSPVRNTDTSTSAEVTTVSKSKATLTIHQLLTTITVIGLAVTFSMKLLLQSFPNFLTNNQEIFTLYRQVLPQGLLSLLIICFTTVMDGIFIGSDYMKEFIFASILSSSAAWGYYWFVGIRLKQGIYGTWNGLLLFSVTRLLFYILNFNKIWKKC